MTDNKSYKDTLNLPKTGFSMKANLANREPEMLKRWDKLEVYKKQRVLVKGREPFILHDGPPYANGDIHLGHAVNKILKDIIIKSKSMSGFDAPFVPGWDCHGLPIELQVEKKKGKAGVKIDAKSFRKACRDYAGRQVDRQRNGFIRLGILGDWQNPYLTMNYQYEANIVRGLSKIVENGHIHKGSKPVHWCVDCGSALAEAEVEYEDKRSPAIDVRFEVLDDEALMSRCHHVENKGQGPLSVVIWTTTPWTLPANEAVALNPELEYVIVECDGAKGTERLLVAEALLKEVMDRWEFNEHKIIAYAKGAALEGLKLKHPFYAKEVPIILGDHVTTEAGTGAVHTAPAHGQDDYVVGSRYQLPVENPVGPDGKFLPNTELFAGEHVFKANDHVLEVLRSNGALVHSVALNHSYPHCWRHKTPIIFRATPQWFISMKQNHLRDMANKAIQEVEWIPDWGKARIESMVENRPDWCISRQRTWGVPITLFVHKETQALHPRTAELMEQIAQRIEQNGIDAWFDLSTEEFLGEEAVHYDKATDTLDVWFDSGVSHFCVLTAREDLSFPADLYLEGSDQHRGWFQSSLLTSIAMNNTQPYRQVLTHGFTVDDKGRKMSKSSGNGVEPDQVTKSLGADILRLWIASTDYRSEMTYSTEIMKRTADAYRRIRNTARFLLANLNGFNPATDTLETSQLLALDNWAIERTSQLQEEIIQAYNNYEFHSIYQKIHNFCTVDMGSFYLDIIKDRQYTAKPGSIPHRSTQTAMHHIVEAFTRWLSPILSFTADEIWQHIPGDRSECIFYENWYVLPTVKKDATFNMDFWKQIIEVRNAVSKELEQLRVAGNIGSSLDAEVILYCGSEIKSQLNQLANELRFVLITSGAEVLADTGKSANSTHVTLTTGDELWIEVSASTNPKCVRCWHHCVEVGQNTQHPELCNRCIDNIDGDGELRQFT